MLQIDLSWWRWRGAYQDWEWDGTRAGLVGTSGEGRTEMFCISSIWCVIKAGWSLGCSFELVHLQSLWALLGIEKTSECWIFTSVAHHYILISWHALSLVNNILIFEDRLLEFGLAERKLFSYFGQGWTPALFTNPVLPLLSVSGFNRLCPWLVVWWYLKHSSFCLFIFFPRSRTYLWMTLKSECKKYLPTSDSHDLSVTDEQTTLQSNKQGQHRK